MSKSRIFLWGMIVGLCTSFPTIYKLYTTPRILADPVSSDFYFSMVKHDLQIKDCPKKGKILRIHIRPQEQVVEAFKNYYKQDAQGLLGFTDYERNEIYSVNDTSVLIHEIRHVFEGSFHR